MIHARRFFAVAALLFCGNVCAASIDTPAGVWQQVDEHSGKPHALVRIAEDHGVYHGRIIKLLNRSAKDVAKRGEHPRCTHCNGPQKNAPLIGLTVLWDLKRDGDRWGDGHVLDPTNGKIYKARMSMEDGGKKLRIRGYVGLSLFGRTEVLLRAPEQ